MALIKCPECNKEISDKAAVCPHCGFAIIPVNQELSTPPNDPTPVPDGYEIIECPEFPIDLNIGQQLVNWAFDCSFEGIYNQSINTIQEIPSGKVSVLLHTHGIRIFGGLTFYPIHNSQLINIQKTSSAEIAKTN